MALKNLAFISYRRDDAQQAAQGLYAQLRSSFGASRVFMDVNTIPTGTQWPDRIKSALEDATIMLVVIGPNWLTAAYRYGRRRLEHKADWVRREIAFGIEKGIPMIPVFVSGAKIPEKEGLPTSLANLLRYEGTRLHDETWDIDFNALVRRLVDCGFVENERSVSLPDPQVQIPPLSDTELNEALSTLEGWEPIESMVPGDYPNSRQELRKVYHFKSFSGAIQFMQAAVKPIDEMEHHPRWQNQWKTVTVWLSTWDIGNRISSLDLELARKLDALREEFKKPKQS